MAGRALLLVVGLLYLVTPSDALSPTPPIYVQTGHNITLCNMFCPPAQGRLELVRNCNDTGRGQLLSLDCEKHHAYSPGSSHRLRASANSGFSQHLRASANPDPALDFSANFSDSRLSLDLHSGCWTLTHAEKEDTCVYEVWYTSASGGHLLSSTTIRVLNPVRIFGVNIIGKSVGDDITLTANLSGDEISIDWFVDGAKPPPRFEAEDSRVTLTVKSVERDDATKFIEVKINNPVSSDSHRFRLQIDLDQNLLMEAYILGIIISAMLVGLTIICLAYETREVKEPLLEHRVVEEDDPQIVPLYRSRYIPSHGSSMELPSLVADYAPAGYDDASSSMLDVSPSQEDPLLPGQLRIRQRGHVVLAQDELVVHASDDLGSGIIGGVSITVTDDEQPGGGSESSSMTQDGRVRHNSSEPGSVDNGGDLEESVLCTSNPSIRRTQNHPESSSMTQDKPGAQALADPGTDLEVPVPNLLDEPREQYKSAPTVQNGSGLDISIDLGSAETRNHLNTSVPTADECLNHISGDPGSGGHDLCLPTSQDGLETCSSTDAGAGVDVEKVTPTENERSILAGSDAGGGLDSPVIHMQPTPRQTIEEDPFLHLSGGQSSALSSCPSSATGRDGLVGQNLANVSVGRNNGALDLVSISQDEFLVCLSAAPNGGVGDTDVTESKV
ncbi:uncharacterized protein [Hyperolius riggenbachi]|uniref:uncharacterized protein n=1 Tax=Hyperolius riggenbachi TaxID=752182 RepID=UPI0035A35361